MMKTLTRVLSFILLIYTVRTTENTTEPTVGVQKVNKVNLTQREKTTFHMLIEGDVFEDTCPIIPFHKDSLLECNYTSSSPLVLIIHGWTLNGIMEQWVFNMASAVKTRLGNVNVLITDWRPLAFKPYPVAAKNSRKVGEDVAKLLQWLEKTEGLSMAMVHIIGFSLGAHVAGFAGSHFKKARKLGRITGLDPASPNFEGVPAPDRLSPDDAKFVDVIHTFSKSGIGVSVGIRQRVGHVDFYPNGGSFQPGCRMMDIYNNIYMYGLEGLPKTIKCPHQRAVHLFIYSLLNPDHQMTAYVCRDESTFNKGLCMDCKHNRCNTMGYDARKVHSQGNIKGHYLKTGPESPYKVFHYQIKVMLTNIIEPVKASISISLNGTKEVSKYLPITLTQVHAENKTYTSLAVVDKDVGELQAVSLRWEEEAGLSSWFRQFMASSWQDTDISVARIRVKAGETQEKTWLCSQAGLIAHLKPSQEQKFVRCQRMTKMQEGMRGQEAVKN